MNSFFANRFHTTHHVIAEDSAPYLVAEIGLNHNGNIEIAKKTIEAAREGGADAVKFQLYTTDFFIYEEDKIKPLKELFSKYELSLSQARELKNYADSIDIDFFATPLTLDWVKNLAEMEVPFIKVASGDLNNYQLLYEIVEKTSLPIIISNGAASLQDFEKTLAFFQYKGMKDVIFLYCVSQYPTPLSSLRLDTIDKIKKMTGSGLIGFSDHTESQLAAFSAVIKGARVIEKHFTLDKNLEGPDHSMSANKDQLIEIRKKIDLACSMKGIKEQPHDEEIQNEYFGKRSIHRINNKLLAMRPRKEGMPKDSDFDHLMWERFNQD